MDHRRLAAHDLGLAELKPVLIHLGKFIVAYCVRNTPVHEFKKVGDSLLGRKECHNKQIFWHTFAITVRTNV